MRRRALMGVIAAVTLIGFPAAPIQAGDWPQILGPNRDGQAIGERLADSWPQSGPRVLWERPVGQGFAGVAAAGGRVVLFHRVGAEELVEALDAQSGATLWKNAFPTRFDSQYSDDSGPRCVPLIHEDRVFLFGAGGGLHCVSFDDGTTLWTREAFAEFEAPDGYFGAGSTPIVEGDKLLVNVGGRKGAGLVAFSLTDGKTVWQGTDEQASYSSPIAVALGGERRVIFVTRYNVVGCDPATGGVRFSFPFGMRGPTVNAATPIVFDGRLFVTSSYGVGAACAKLAGDSAEIVWKNDATMSSQYTTCVHKEGVLYGVDGRQDVGVAALKAFDPVTGKVRWAEEGFGMATLILADDKLLIMKTDGELILAQASPDRYRPLARARIFNATARPLPALADGRLYVRDTKSLKCLEVGSEASRR